MHLAPLIRDLAIILGVAGLITLLFQRIRQPVVLGYLLAGVIIGPYTPPFQWVSDVQGIQIWAELGVIFLMFSLGLEFSFRKLTHVGLPAGITAGTEVLFFLPFGYIVGRLMGWTSMDSVFLGAMLSISSTTIIIKALSELKLKSERFATVIFGVLIVEDLIAVLLLVALSTVAVNQTVNGGALLAAAGKLILVVGAWFICGYVLVPRFVKYVGRVGSDETLTIVSLGLCLALVVFANHFHYSAALGAFIMGSILAESPLLPRIETRMESLRDLFGAIFFVSIGMLIDPRILWEHRGAVAILSLATIGGKIFSTCLGALLSGQSLRTSVQVGFGLAQIGEFSFIIAGLGTALNATSNFVYPVIVTVSLLTTFTTPYLIRLSGPAATWIERHLPRRASRLLERYAERSESARSSALQRKHLWHSLFKWSLNGIVVSVIFVVESELLFPYLAEHQMLSWGSRLISWLMAAAISSPFIGAMLRAQFIGSRVLTILWIAALSFEFFPTRVIALVTAFALALLFGLFYRRLDRAYVRLENHFLSSFEKQPHHGEKTHVPHIVDYTPQLKPYFEKLNREWIEKHFTIEPHDIQIFSDPENEILKKGGDLFFAELDGDIVGTCSLIQTPDALELCKLAVTDKAKGKGIGELLTEEAIRRARAMGAKTLRLTTNSTLLPAVRLYEKLGFEITHRGPHPVYKRVDLVMEKKL